MENSPGWSSTDKEHFSMQSGERDVRKGDAVIASATQHRNFGYAAP
ncbi:hypothetical protein ACIXMT_10050 [Bacteroides fragilis]